MATVQPAEINGCGYPHGFYSYTVATTAKPSSGLASFFCTLILYFLRCVWLNRDWYMSATPTVAAPSLFHPSLIRCAHSKSSAGYGSKEPRVSLDLCFSFFPPLCIVRVIPALWRRIDPDMKDVENWSLTLRCWRDVSDDNVRFALGAVGSVSALVTMGVMIRLHNRKQDRWVTHDGARWEIRFSFPNKFILK